MNISTLLFSYLKVVENHDFRICVFKTILLIINDTIEIVNEITEISSLFKKLCY